MLTIKVEIQRAMGYLDGNIIVPSTMIKPSFGFKITSTSTSPL